MITAVHPKLLIWLFAVIFGVALLLCFAWYGLANIPLAGMWAYAGLLSKAVTIAVSVSLLLGNYRVIDWLWTRVPMLNTLVPNLNGRYELVTTSNWPLQKSFLAQREGKVDGLPQQLSPLEVTGQLAIKLGFFRLSVRYIPSATGPSTSSSDVLAASIGRDNLSGDFELNYIYRSTVTRPDPATDSEHYYGAARFRVERSTTAPSVLAGTYWTNRSWQKGINTAGEARATRVS